MAAYAAVVSLKQTIQHILDSCRYFLVPPSPEIIRLVWTQLEPLKRTLERLDSSSISKSRKKVNALDREIKEAVWKLEDVLETLMSDQILSQSESDLLLFTIDLQSLQPHVDSFVKAVKDLEVKYIYELQNMGELEEDELGSSTNYSGGDMVGFSCSFEKVKNDLTQNWDGNYIHSFLGMGGSGKTTLVKKIFEDPEVLRNFEYGVWVSVGRKSQFNEIAQAILAQLDPNTYNVDAEEEVNIGMYLKKGLEGKRCLIVLDDVWDAQLLDYLTPSLPDKNSAILLTTRLPTVADHTFKPEFFHFLIKMLGLNEQESKELLRKKVFGEKEFPPQLREAAEKIANNCEGLPLMIVTVADLISKANNNIDPLYWNEVAERRSSVFMDAYNQISEVLFPTYDVFPQHVKMILIYAGVFPQYETNPVWYLINLLSAERFSELQKLKENVHQTLNEFGWKCDILDLQHSWMCDERYGNIRVYSWWLHLFNREASKDKFLLVFTSDTDFRGEGIKGQRRLCLNSNFIFNFKEVHNSVKCDCASTTRSLLCFGPYHRYSMPLNVGFKLLRVLDAHRVRFYNFPLEILELVLLQYLSLTCNGELPTSISKLFNLEFLIIRPHMHIKPCGAPLYAPIGIWDMKELKCIRIVGSNLPNPNSASSLQKLFSLRGVSSDNCTMEVFEKVPNLKILGIEIQLKPYVDDSNPLCCLDHISTLKNLELLECSVNNPEVTNEFVALPTPPSLSMFPSSLQKLVLRGLGYSWKHMKAIGLLPNLEVLCLGCNAFRGPKWGTRRKSFLSLKALIIEDCDLVQWKPRCGSFPKLERLGISLFSLVLCLFLLGFRIVIMMFLFVSCRVHVCYVHFCSVVLCVCVDTSLTDLTMDFSQVMKNLSFLYMNRLCTGLNLEKNEVGSRWLERGSTLCPGPEPRSRAPTRAPAEPWPEPRS